MARYTVGVDRNALRTFLESTATADPHFLSKNVLKQPFFWKAPHMSAVYKNLEASGQGIFFKITFSNSQPAVRSRDSAE